MPAALLARGYTEADLVKVLGANVRRVFEAVQASGGTCLITADHGNAEHMLEDDGFLFARLSLRG